MRSRLVADLSQFREFRQMLQAGPGLAAHASLFLLAGLLGTALLWAGLTEADLVVRAPGRVRPVRTPIKVCYAGRTEVFNATAGGRVVAVHFRQGDEVHQGDVLVRLDTERLENDISRRKRTIQAAEEELTNLDRLAESLTRQYQAAQVKAEAELSQAIQEFGRDKKRQSADVRQAQAELDAAVDDESRLKTLVQRQAAAIADLVKATAHVQELREKLEKARLVPDESKAVIARAAAALAEKDYQLKDQELKINRDRKRGELEAARLELTNLELERKQSILQAPIDGVIVAGDVKLGDLLEPGKPVAEIAEQKGFRLEALVSSEEVAHLRVGMPARVKLDAFDYQQYGTVSGTVCFISPDSERAEGQRSAAYVVRIELENNQVASGSHTGLVKLGMAGQVEIVTSRESLLALFLKRIRQTISLN